VPDIAWIPADKNPWNVPVLDVRPYTTTLLSTSSDPTCATNAVSFGQDDGTGFIGQIPLVRRSIPASLHFSRDRFFADGALFLPRQMEHKWALYHHRGLILFIRSWLRKVFATARVDQRGETITLTEITGSLSGEEAEDPRLTIRIADFLLRSHALGLAWPAPFPPALAKDPQTAARWCFSSFGNMAHLATHHEPRLEGPRVALRSHSLLHIAVARGDKGSAQACLRSGIPVDLLAADGLPPLQWALAAEGTSMLEFLLANASGVDARSLEGATALMTATQGDRSVHLEWLLSHGADVNARDARGFTALHRAAEMGKDSFVEILLAHGADPAIEAEGHTAISFAERQGHSKVVQRLRKAEPRA
jgi:hypothetical protein